MRLIIIRHGDPDYEHDSLTPKGWREAELLSHRISRLDIRDIYCSPLGRAKATAKPSLEKLGREAVECQWLREFSPKIRRPDVTDRRKITWDWLPQDWMIDDRYYDADQWMHTEIMEEGGVPEACQWVCDSFDAMLADHGYVREGRWYRVERANMDTIVMFCHYGVSCLLLAHLMNISPMPLWHGYVSLPTGVTIVNTEERRKGIASFRASAMGDLSHLYAGGEEAAFAARFCECYDNEDERHD